MLRNASVDDSNQPDRAEQSDCPASLLRECRYANRDPASNVAPGMPVFVLNNGTVLAVSGYGYQDSRITYSLVGGGSGVISTDDVDWTTTTRINEQRGVRAQPARRPRAQGTRASDGLCGAAALARLLAFTAKHVAAGRIRPGLSFSC